ncbi:MAG: perosamine synthetase [Acidobacteriota bacterium]|jgi:perosamine synthetase|nr:perosamine synthetase [Acidobacteriota bacterium]
MTTSFEPGAPAQEGSIPLSVPEIGGNAWKYVNQCLDTGWVSSVGAFVDRFESDLAAYVGAKYGVAACSGTAALHIALLVANVQPDDEVLISTLTFIAPANAVRYVGAWPVFIDAEPEYWQLDVTKVAAFLEDECAWSNGELRNKTTGRRVKGILPVHILGHPVDMDPLLELARKYDLVVIEDATEGLGAKYKGRMIGHIGDIGCFSFNGNKIITTGGGGMLVTDNQAWATKAKYLSTQAKDDPVEYIHHQIGYNYRLTNIQAALGCAQMEQLPDHIAIKRRIASLYTESFKEITSLTPMREAPWASSVFWLYTLLVDESVHKKSSRELMRALDEQAIQARPLWQPLHLSHAHAGSQSYQCVESERLNRTALSLPSSIGLSSEHQTLVINAVRDFFLLR